ncbi:MAG: HEAT repeat domain-containing protein [bacterium]
MVGLFILIAAISFVFGKDLSKAEQRLYDKCLKIVKSEFNNPNYYVKSMAISAATDSRDMAFESDLHLFLKDTNKNIQLEAAKGLFALGNLDGVGVAEEIVKTPIEVHGDINSPVIKMKFLSEENIRIKAAKILGDIGRQESIDILKKIKKTETGRMRDAASIAIAMLGDTTETILFESAIKDEDKFVRITAIKALEEIASRKTLSSVVKALEDSDSEVRAEATGALGNIGSLEAFDDLKSMLYDPVDTVRSRAVEGLGKMEDRSIIPILKEFLEDNNGSIRIVAAKSLGILGSNAGLDTIKVGMQNEDPDVRERVVEALKYIEHKKSVEFLENMLDDKEDRIRLDAAGVILLKLNRARKH